jgi:hypothetical protein
VTSSAGEFPGFQPGFNPGLRPPGPLGAKTSRRGFLRMSKLQTQGEPWAQPWAKLFWPLRATDRGGANRLPWKESFDGGNKIPAISLYYFAPSRRHCGFTAIAPRMALRMNAAAGVSLVYHPKNGRGRRRRGRLGCNAKQIRTTGLLIEVTEGDGDAGESASVNNGFPVREPFGLAKCEWFCRPFSNARLFSRRVLASGLLKRWML